MKPADFNLRHLRALAAAVRARTLTGAAGAVGLSQPAMTQAVARLEALVGASLFGRSAGGVSPTEAAVLLGARAEAAAAAIAAAMQPARRGGIGAEAGAADVVTMAQLTALIAFADGGSYAAGAALAGVSQPTLHRSVGDLEKAAGVELVERAGRGAALTTAGSRLVRAFRLALSELQAGIDELAVLAGRDQGTIRIGASDGLTDRLLAPILARFLADHPPVVIDIVRPAAADALNAVRDGRIDLAVISEPGEASRPGLMVETLGPDPFIVAARAGHPLAGGPLPGLVRLAGFGWALPGTGSQSQAAFDAMFLAGGVYAPAPGVTCPSLTGLATLVAGCDMLTVLPAMMVEQRPEALAAIGALLEPAPLVRLYTRADWAPTPAQATLVEELGRAVRPLHQF